MFVLHGFSRLFLFCTSMVQLLLYIYSSENEKY